MSFSPVMRVIETQLRLALLRLDTSLATSGDRAYQDRLLDVRHALTPALELLEERRRAIDPDTVELPIVPRSHAADIDRGAITINEWRRR